ncbi:glycosyl transferase [Pseudomonas kurunegalensis]|uniref:glycosyl transferase n=1 Tax=Pseudomonas kurunegalensis TaxID=485880 RepID=UPI002570F2C0|nr:glycosyl transferase [Pseudomonas kurunegalensis]WJD64037.1 glycosyl transferase [Pseudomonas kurunegalensis]
MQLIYLSPVPWSSFAQRPQKFASWFNDTTQGKVLWVDPYPTRLPRLSDLTHSRGCDRGIEVKQPWVTVIQPRSLPVEPLPFSGTVNSLLFWTSIISSAQRFAKAEPTMIVAGKPSELAIRMIQLLPESPAIYDAMDDFPAFFSGFSRQAMQRREQRLASLCRTVLTSSTKLVEKWTPQHADVRFVANALDTQLIPAWTEKQSHKENIVFGYVGTVGAWFDWDWVIRLAHARPLDTLLIVGPISNRYAGTLPANIVIRPPCSHREALELMRTFNVALIPFQKTSLTASVDPIKYYEYIASGLPVLTSSFGEMHYRRNEKGVYICDTNDNMDSVVAQALSYTASRPFIESFKLENNWVTRFDNASLL